LKRLAVAFLALTALPAHAQEADGAYARGALAWIFSDKLDLIGSMSAEVPFAHAGGWRVYAGARADTAIAKANDFTFQVNAVSYAAGFGARLRLAPGHGAIELSAFERGRQTVDAPGRARVRAAGTAWSSDGWDDGFAPEGFSGRVALAAVFEEHGVDAVATTEGGVRWMHRFGASGSKAFGLDLTWDALLGTDSGVDVLAGPRFDFDLGGGRRFGLYARYLESGNPLGLDTDGLLVGFDFGQGVLTSGGRSIPPEIAGLVAAGGGDGGRGFARLDLRVQTPPFLGGLYGEIEVDGNVLSADDVNDLFYRYDVGLAHAVGASWRAGGFFYHRSNHVLDQANATVTSINVVEAMVETSGWNRATPGVSLGAAGGFDLTAHAGAVVDSSLDNGRDWLARAGARWSSPEWGRVRLYVSAEAERGEATSSLYALGLLLPHGLDLRVTEAHDEQLFSADQRGWLGIVTLRY
jgi:hypothetical protein